MESLGLPSPALQERRSIFKDSKSILKDINIFLVCYNEFVNENKKLYHLRKYILELENSSNHLSLAESLEAYLEQMYKLKKGSTFNLVNHSVRRLYGKILEIAQLQLERARSVIWFWPVFQTC